MSIEKGRITLEGEVEKQFERGIELQVVLHLAGVMGVNNQIVLKPKVSQPPVPSRRQIVSSTQEPFAKRGSALTTPKNH